MSKLPLDHRLNELLHLRATPLPQDDFSARIISSSRDVMQRKNVTVTILLKRIFTEFSLPTPAFALASILLGGFLLGLGLQDFSISDANNAANPPDLIFSEESVL